MSNIQYGCQTYPWKMKQEAYMGNLPHMLQSASKAGFTGLEAEICMLGDYFYHPEQAKELFLKENMSLAALVLHQPWELPEQTEEEDALTNAALSFLKHFPGARLMVSHHAGSSPRQEGEALMKRRRNLISCMDAVSNQAAQAGIVTCYHPNSSLNSLFRTEEDYNVLFDLLKTTDIGYAPDIGHIVNGGMDPLKILQENVEKIRHVHFKDRTPDGQWAVMGEGSIDYVSIVRYLEKIKYRGWIMVEDESPMAANNPDAVVMQDGHYMRQFFTE